MVDGDVSRMVWSALAAMGSLPHEKSVRAPRRPTADLALGAGQGPGPSSEREDQALRGDAGP